jgi:hypothetical protein
MTPLKIFIYLSSFQTFQVNQKPLLIRAHPRLLFNYPRHNSCISGTKYRYTNFGENPMNHKPTHKKSEKRLYELKQSEERYRIAVENSNDGVALLKGDKHIYVNRRFVEMFGYESPNDVVGKPLSIIVHPDDLALVADLAARRQLGELFLTDMNIDAFERMGLP